MLPKEYLDGFVADVTGGAGTDGPEAASVDEPTAVALPESEYANAPVILSVEDLHIRFRVKRPSRQLMKRFLRPGGESERTSQGTAGSIEVHGLRGVSFTLRQGEHVGLVGLNGSGKTTLLRAISGVLPPGSGSVNAPEKIYALLSLSAGFDQQLSGYENLWLRALYSGFPRSQLDDYVRDVIEFSDLGEFFFLPMKTYSAGMKARFALGVATLGRPNLLIMDEWVGAGDMEFRAKAHARLKDFVSSSGALLIASHSYAILQAWVTRLIWLHEGRIMADGPRDDVFKSYSAFLAARR